MGRTHALAGVASLWAVAGIPGVLTPDTLAPLALFGALGALSPDLDAGDSQVKRLAFAGITPFAPVSVLMHRTWGHRCALHSLAGWGVFTLLMCPLATLDSSIPVALCLGYGSHLAADACTKSGIPFLYPRRRRYHLMPKALRLTTGSPAEDAVFAALGASVLLLLLRLLPSAALP